VQEVLIDGGQFVFQDAIEPVDGLGVTFHGKPLQQNVSPYLNGNLMESGHLTYPAMHPT
jgi:hypothetical protein